MTDQELEQRIAAAVRHCTPDLTDKILSSCNQQETAACVPDNRERPAEQTEGVIMKMSEKEKKNTGFGKIRKSLTAAATAAAAFLLCFGGYQLTQRNRLAEADSLVILDVNPSLSLSVDADERVLSAEALNDDALEILGDMELNNTSLDVAVNAIIGSMLQKGYLGGQQNTILVSVENGDTARGEALQQKVLLAIDSAARSASLDTAVLSQVIPTGDTAALDSLAEQYGISPGKAALIQEVIEQVPTLTFEDLAPMTINEIALIAASKDVEGTGVIQNGRASEGAYISREDALALIYEHADVLADEITEAEISFDSRDGIMIYKAEFETAAREGEYEIDASTGEILQFKLKDRDDSPQADPSEGSSVIGEAAAREAALAHAGVTADSTVYIKCYTEYENGMPFCYCVEFKVDHTEYEYKIDLYSGNVLDFDTESHDNSGNREKHDEEAPEEAACIGESAALAAALQHAGISADNLTETKVEPDKDKDRLIYKIEFKTENGKYEYKIDAVSGALLEAEVH